MAHGIQRFQPHRRHSAWHITLENMISTQLPWGGPVCSITENGTPEMREACTNLVQAAGADELYAQQTGLDQSFIDAGPLAAQLC